jgi:hypothetical protein
MNIRPEPQEMPNTDVTRLLRDMRLEAAVRLLKHAGAELDPAMVKSMILEYENQAKRTLAADEIGESKRLTRRATALKGLLVHGPDPAKMVTETDLPGGYVGKILMVLLTGGGFDDVVCLRTGDSWHREILHNTHREIADLGFFGTEVNPIGGAYAGFDTDGSIAIWGTSDEYGCCDKALTARMIGRAYPERTVRIVD